MIMRAYRIFAGILLVLVVISSSDMAQTFVSGTIPSNTTWTIGNSPYIVDGTLTVPSGVILTIDPGVEVQIYEDMSINVNGTLLAQGTVGNEITFSNSPPQSGGYFHFDGGNYSLLGATGVFEYCSFTALSGDIGRIGLPILYTTYTVLNISDCTFSNTVLPSTVIQPWRSRLWIVRNVMHDNAEGINAKYCAGVIGTNNIYNTIGNADAIDIDFIWGGSGNASIVVEQNIVRDGPHLNADGIDLGTASGIIRANIISGFGDKGISIGEGSYPEIYNNFIQNCAMGIAIKDGSIPVIENNTIVDCTFGIKSYEKNAGLGGGKGSFYNGIIWNCGTSIQLRDGSTLDTGYSTIQGASVWPGEGNIINNPQFVETGTTNYHLLPGSPSVNGGRNEVWMTGVTDLETNERIIYGLADMGVYEMDFNLPRSLWILSPRGEALQEVGATAAITLVAYGSNWIGGDMVTLQMSSDGGGMWTNLSGASNLAYDQGSYSWDTTGLATGDLYKVKVFYNSDTNIMDESDRYFSLLTPVLDHFVWNPISSPQYANLPIAVTITATTPAGNTFFAFNGTVNLTSEGGGAGSVERVIGNGASTSEYPLPSAWDDARTQVIYLQSEVGGISTITGLSLNVTMPTGFLRKWSIRLKHTSVSSYPGSPVWEGRDSGWTEVYQKDLTISSTGWRTFLFMIPFSYNGTDNLYVDFFFDGKNDAPPSGECLWSPTAQDRSIFFKTFGAYGNPEKWNGSSPPPGKTNSVPDIKLLTYTLSGIPLSMTPTVSGNFVNGVWTGTVTVLESAANAILKANDGSGHTGDSAPFNVEDSPGNYRLELATTNASGSLDVASGWFAIGSNVTVTATPDPYYSFISWQGDTNGCVLVGNVITAVMDQARSIMAVFDENLATNSTPEWWLASFGLTNGSWDSEALADQDNDGMTAWQEYIAGTDPTNNASTFKITDLFPMTTNYVVMWNSVSGKAYTVLTSTNMMSAWTNVTDPAYTNVPGTGSPLSFTNMDPQQDSLRFFRIKLTAP